MNTDENRIKGKISKYYIKMDWLNADKDSQVA